MRRSLGHLSEAARRALEPYFPDLDLSRVRIYEGIPWYVRGAPLAYTDRNRIFIQPGSYAPDDAAGLALIGHELVHSEQYRREGKWRFRARYLASYFRNRLSGMPARLAYLRIPYEVEARAVEEEILRNLRREELRQEEQEEMVHRRSPGRASENTQFILDLLTEGLSALGVWQSRWGDYEISPALEVDEERARRVMLDLARRLEENYPFFHPDYAGQMLKPPHAVASAAYFLAQQINPNNHALDGGPATARMEQEVVAELARMFGYETHLGHLTSSGTIANLEALWVARSLAPDRAIAFSREAHYTHARMCEVIGARTVVIETDARGRIDLDDLRAKLKTGDIATLVLTAGTTAIGAVDPIDEALSLQREFGFRLHVDAAYGGFFRLLADEEGVLEPETAAAFRAIAQADSIVVDPHKHGLQPYGCGSVLFRDPAVGRFYRHDSPYTYFTSKELHLGEISLECSRAGAAAAALWATLECFPLRADGLGAVLRETRRAAKEWARLIGGSERLRLVVDPELDIVTFYPVASVDGENRVSEISRLSERIFERTMNRREAPVYLAKFMAKRPLAAGDARLVWDEPVMTALRSVLMKPEHLARVGSLHERVLAALEG